MARDDQVTAVTDVTRPMPSAAGSDCLVVIYSDQKSILGRRFPLEAGPVRIGREEDNEIVLSEKSVSRRHARFERTDGGWSIADAGSSNGTLLNERELLGRAVLSRDDRIKIGSTIFKYLNGADVESAFHEEIYQLSIIDHLTGLQNRRAFDDAFEREFSRARRYGRRLAVAMIDVDLFKRINDDWGHPVGDVVLAHVADALRGCVREDETLARFGGEEFALVLPESDLQGAAALGERLRSRVEGRDIGWQGTRIPVTISVGCAELSAADKHPRTLLQRADERLYAAKRAGRNQVAS